MPQYTPAVALLAVALYFFFATQVAAAHRAFDVKLPAMTGHPEFERVVRIHANTLEWMPTFMVTLWLCAFYLSDVAAASLGLVWVGGRVVYYLGYRQAVAKRLPGFLIQTTACILLFLGALAGIVLRWVGA